MGIIGRNTGIECIDLQSPKSAFPGMLNEDCGVVHNTGMNDPQPFDPRRRIRELLAIPDRDRTDEQWDELNELEIRTAPGNRESDRQSEKRPGPMGQSRRPDRNQGPKNNNNGPRLDARPDARPQEGRPEGPRPPKRQHRRPKRPMETPGNQ